LVLFQTTKYVLKRFNTLNNGQAWRSSQRRCSANYLLYSC